jgi:hypothetical protein
MLTQHTSGEAGVLAMEREDCQYQCLIVGRSMWSTGPIIINFTAIMGNVIMPVDDTNHSYIYLAS